MIIDIDKVSMNMKDYFESGMSLESMSEEELREAARLYARELMETGGSPDLPEPVPVEVSTNPQIALQSDPIPEEETQEFSEEVLSETTGSAIKTEETTKKKRLFSRGGRKQSEEMQNLAKNVAAKSADYGLSNPEIAADGPSIDLTKLKKNDLLEIMLRQSEEIDALRAEVADLKSQLQSREIKIATSGSIAEASLKLSKIFEEAQYAADLYLANIRRETDQHDDPEFMIRGADYDE